MSVKILLGERERGRFVAGSHAWRQPKPHWEKAWLEDRYSRGMSASEIAAAAGCTGNNILFWLNKHGIPRRSVSQARARKHWGVSGPANPMFGKTGASNPNFVDGSAPERQRLYARYIGRDFLAGIYRRDGFKCVRCGTGKRGPRSLHAHHIKPWAGNAGLRFVGRNVVTLCGDCHRWVHSKLNKRREYLA